MSKELSKESINRKTNQLLDIIADDLNITKGQYQKQKMGKVYYSKDSKTFIGNHSFNEPPYDNLIEFFNCKPNDSGECLTKSLESIGYKDLRQIEEFIKCLTK